MKKKEKNILYGIVAAFLLLIFIAYVFVPFISDVIDIGDRLKTAEKRFLRMERLIKQKDFLSQDLARVKKVRSELLNKLYVGNDPNRIIPRIHSYIAQIASKNGIEVRRITNVSGKQFVFSKKTLERYPFLNKVRKINVMLEALGKPAQMFKFIDEIEKSDKYLQFEFFAVNAWNMRPDKTINFKANLFTYFVKSTPVSGMGKKRKRGMGRKFNKSK